MNRVATIEDEPPRRGLWAWLLVPLILAAGGGVGALLAVRANDRDQSARKARLPAAAVLTVTESPPQTVPSVAFAPALTAVTVPDVRGERLPDARKTLRKAGLVTEQRHVPSTLPKKTVVAQVPAPGTTAERGDDVVVGVSVGTKKHAGNRHERPDHRHGPLRRSKGGTTSEQE